MAEIGGGGIKSIQRGATTSSPGSNTSGLAVTINAVDADKTFISSSNKAASGNYVTTYNYGAFSYAANSETGTTLVSSTQFKIYPGPTATSATMANPTTYWEVIEHV